MKRQHRLQVHLQQEADAILREGNSSILTRNVGRDTGFREVNRAIRASRDARTEEFYRQLPKEARRDMTDRFKADRTSGAAYAKSWQDWLARELETNHGLSLQ